MHHKVFLAAIMSAALAGMASAHPHDLKRALVTEVTFTTVTLANVIVWVDGNGVPVETTTVHLATSPQSAPAQVTSSITSVVSKVVEPEQTPAAPEVIPTSLPQPPAAGAVDAAPVANFPPQLESQSAVVTEAPAASPSESATASSSQAETPVPFTPPAPVAEVQGPSSAPFTLPSPTPEPQQPSSSPSTPPTSSAEPVPTSSASPEPSKVPERKEPVKSDGFPIGITYDPFKSGACKTEEEVRDEWQRVKEYGIVRIYGMGCGIVPRAVRLAKEHNQKIFAGIWMSAGSDNENMDTVVKELASAVRDHANGDWSVIGMVSVANERVNQGAFTASNVVDAINRGRKALRAAGFSGPVGAVETVNAVLDNPAICEASDIAMINVHSFFDPHTTAEDSGKFIKGMVTRVEEACRKRTVVTEAGWPHTGDSHDKAVPSRENQKAAIASILREFNHDLFLFNAFDCPWKSDWAGSFNAEKYWGLF